MQAVTERMQANLAEFSDTGNSLEACFGRLNAVLGQMEGLSAELKRSDPQIAERCNAAEVERWLSALYTTEIERDVMNSALHGTPMPVVQQSFAGNAVELF